MKTKFGNQFKSDCAAYVRLVKRTRDFNEQLISRLDKYRYKYEIADTAAKMAQASLEFIDNISDSLRKGYILQAILLLRIYLEMSHLLLYLAENPDEYEKWLNGKHVRPADIGKYFEEKKFPTWKETYEDLSNYTHMNSAAIQDIEQLFQKTPKNAGPIMIVARVLMNIFFITHKVNAVLHHIYMNIIGHKNNGLVRRFRSIESAILQLSNDYVNMENRFLRD